MQIRRQGHGLPGYVPEFSIRFDCMDFGLWVNQGIKRGKFAFCGVVDPYGIGLRRRIDDRSEVSIALQQMSAGLPGLPSSGTVLFTDVPGLVVGRLS